MHASYLGLSRVGWRVSDAHRIWRVGSHKNEADGRLVVLFCLGSLGVVHHHLYGTKATKAAVDVPDSSNGRSRFRARRA